MFKTIARMSALAAVLTVLIAPANQMYAAGSTTPTVVTGGDPQPTGEIMRTILLMPSIVVL